MRQNPEETIVRIQRTAETFKSARALARYPPRKDAVSGSHSGGKTKDRPGSSFFKLRSPKDFAMNFFPNNKITPYEILGP